MKKHLYLAFSAMLLLASAIQTHAAIATVNFDSGSQTVFDSNGITPLAGGNPAIDGDGTVLQLGYFSAATNATPFAGTWIALTGEGGANSAFANTTIGNDFMGGAGDGSFAMSLTFDTADSTKNNSLPAVGTPLGIRIYNNMTIAASSRYMTISNPATTWQWVAPNTPPNNPSVNLSLDDAGLRRETDPGTGAGVATSSFSTTIPLTPVPEPSTFICGALLALAGLCPRSRRRK